MDNGWPTRTDGSKKPAIVKWVPMVRREIAVDGKSYQVEVTECPIGSPFPVKVNNKSLEVTLEQEPSFEKGFQIKVRGKIYEVELAKAERDTPFSVKVNNIPFKIELRSAVPTPKIVIVAPSVASVQVQKPTRVQGEGMVVAPMAGRIISIRVKKGDSVKVGSVLCVLEAMKMENEIASPKSGTVDEIKAQEGKAVNEGDILILIK